MTYGQILILPVSICNDSKHNHNCRKQYHLFSFFDVDLNTQASLKVVVV